MVPHFAFATATAALRRRLSGEAGGTNVSVLPPDLIPVDGQRRLNVFLFRMREDRGTTAASMPARDATGARRETREHYALDYLISAHGSTAFDAESLLGGALGVLRDFPVATADSLAAALAAVRGARTAPPDEAAWRIDALRFAVAEMPLADLVGLWQACRTPYRPGLAVTATLTLTTLHPAAVPPVLRRPVP